MLPPMLMLSVLSVVILLNATSPAAAAGPSSDPPPPPLKVFVLAGQSNMEGKAKVSLLEYQSKQPATRDRFKHLLASDGAWKQRDDVWIKFLDRHGRLTVGYGSPGCIGPELEFGNVVGDRFDQPILLIKTAWGGRSLYKDFRPPSAGPPSDAIVQKQLTERRKRTPNATADDVLKEFGSAYRDMLREVRETLANVDTLFPTLVGRKPELAGLVWFQGWNDMIDPAYTAAYADNLAHFIKDVRQDLAAPNLPIVVGQMGVDGDAPDENVKRFKAAQSAGVAADEFRGNVTLVKTDVFWDQTANAVFKKGWREHKEEWDTVGSDYPYHYLGSTKTMSDIGRALGEAMVGMTNTGPGEAAPKSLRD